MANKNQPRIILASVSPRRRELLGLLGFEFEVIPSKFDESVIDENQYHPTDFVMLLAREKALDVARQITGDAVVIGADTTVVLDGRYYNKPETPEHAKRMLHELAGRTHQVFTGVAVIPVKEGKPGEPITDYVATGVTFDILHQNTIDAYVATGEPLDKAGAYGIQGKALAFIPGIHGDYFNVVGLPLHKLCEMLGKIGVSVW